MRFLDKRILLPISAIGAILVGMFVVYVLTGLEDAIKFKAMHLRIVRKAWLHDGSPVAPMVAKYTNATNSTFQTFVWTNVYVIKGKKLESIFATDTTEFEGKGILVVTKDGQIVWIDKKKGPRLVDE